MLLVETFACIAADDPNRPLFTFVDVHGRDRATLTFGEAYTQAAAVAEHLRDKAGLQPGDRAVLVYPPALSYATAVMGCLMAGVVPVPVYPTDPFKLQHDLTGFTRLVADCQPKTILTNGEFNMLRRAGSIKDMLMRTGTVWPDLPWRTTDRLGRVGQSFSPHRAHPGDIALLQYTSGSTSAPKGVILTHANIMGEIADNARSIGLNRDAIGVTWVPQYHDLGLICCVMGVMAGNGRLYMISPLSFLHRPAVWFDVMQRVGATHTCSPNFGLEHAVKHTTAQERARWDLSGLKVLLCGAEPIRRKTVDAFYDAFAESRLGRATFVPAYGLAENTVSVACAPRSYLRFDRAQLATGVARVVCGDGDAVELFSNGPIEKVGCVVRIVDPETSDALPEGCVGEIWVDSPTKAAGYFGREEETLATFKARITGEQEPREYLRTGDLGFFFQGELFVAGRIKEVVIVRGRNYYPHDIEQTARDAHALALTGSVAAFGMSDPAGGEGFGLLIELHDANADAECAKSVIDAVHAALRRDHSVPCIAIGVGSKGAVPKTTTRKIRRTACRAIMETARASSPLLALRRFEVTDVHERALTSS
jgi:acyl-CoA synthetase (AMP-forming)/AMP-acid ligase II